jgi:hypothetical protein
MWPNVNFCQLVRLCKTTYRPNAARSARRFYALLSMQIARRPYSSRYANYSTIGILEGICKLELTAISQVLLRFQVLLSPA